MNGDEEQLDGIMKAAISTHIGRDVQWRTRRRIRKLAKGAVGEFPSASPKELKEIVIGRFRAWAKEHDQLTDSGEYVDVKQSVICSADLLYSKVPWVLLIELIVLAIKWYLSRREWVSE